MVQAQYDWSKHWEQVAQEPTPIRKVKKTYKKVNYGRKLIINLTGFAFIYALILVFLCIKGATLGYQIVELEKEIKFHESQNAGLQYSIQENCSLDKVEYIAINQLNMHKPEQQLAIALSTSTVTAGAGGETSMNDDELAQLETKPLYKIYANLLLLAQKD